MIEASLTASTNGQQKPITRREFLYYLLGASGLALAAGTCGAASWLTIPHRSFNPQGGFFVFSPAQIPSPQDVPHLYVNERFVPMELGIYITSSTNFWLSTVDQGLFALRGACPRE